MAVIKFKEYNVDKIEYIKNPNFDLDETEQYEIVPEFSATIAIKERFGMVVIGCQMGEFNNIRSPYKLNVEIKGFFEYDMDSEESTKDIDFQDLLSSNAIAILYPYLRSLVEDITAKGNEFPAYTLPVMNFVEVLKKNDKIEFIDFDKSLDEVYDNEV